MTFVEILKQSDRMLKKAFGIERSPLQQFVSPVKALYAPVRVTFSRAGNKLTLEWTTDTDSGILK